MRIHDGLIGLFFIMLGIYVVWEAASFPAMPGQAIGPGTFPTIFGGLFVAGGLIVGRAGLAAGLGRLVVLDEGWRRPERAAAASVAIIGTLILAFFFTEIGFLLGGSLLLTAIFWLTGHRSPLWIVVSIGFVSLVYLAMSKLLLVPLPAGPLS